MLFYCWFFGLTIFIAGLGANFQFNLKRIIGLSTLRQLGPIIMTIMAIMWRVWGRGEGCTGFWWGNLRERDHLGDPDVDGRIILSWIFRKCDVGFWVGSTWLGIGTGGGDL